MTISRHPSTASRFRKYPFNAALNLERFGEPLRQSRLWRLDQLRRVVSEFLYSSDDLLVCFSAHLWCPGRGPKIFSTSCPFAKSLSNTSQASACLPQKMPQVVALTQRVTLWPATPAVASAQRPITTVSLVAASRRCSACALSSSRAWRRNRCRGRHPR